jgi:hypothetical protein
MNFDPDVVLGMAFTVVMMLLVGGFLVAIPIIRRLGKLTDEWVRSRREGLPGESEWSRLTAHLESINSRLGQIERDQSHMSERQEFVEGLVTGAQQRSIGVAE